MLKRPLNRLQFLGAGLIVLSIVVAKLPDLFGKATVVNAIPIAAVILALVGSTNSGMRSAVIKGSNELT